MMQLDFGQQVFCSDGPAGELADVAIEPMRRRVTHLVVQPHGDHGNARLVPVELARDGNENGTIAIACTTSELHDLPPVEEFEYRQFGEPTDDDPSWDTGIETPLVWPAEEYVGIGDNPFDVDPHIAFVRDRVPKGDVELRRSSEVVSADGHRVGRVDGFVIDGNGRITEVVFERRRFFRRSCMTIPVAAIGELANDSVKLDVGKDDLAHGENGKLGALS